MSKKNKPAKKATIVSLISGKGGVGKTALTASMGKLLAMMGYKVLLVDFDLITHGLTFLLGFDSKKAGFLEAYNNYRAFERELVKNQKNTAKIIVDSFVEKFEQEETCKVSENLQFLQSTSMPSRKYSQQVSSESQSIVDFFTRYLSELTKSKDYDFILIDTQAGAVDTTRAAVTISDKVVTVMEPDPVATYATENVVGELRDALPRDSFYVINKLSVEEAAAYEALEAFLKILRHLPPVPFDFEVRRAFMIRQIPVDEKKPSAFLFGVVRMMRDLLPSVSENLERFEKEAENKAVLPIREKMKSIEDQLNLTAVLRAKIAKRLDVLQKKDRPLRLTRLSFSFAAVLMSVITLSYVMLNFYQGQSPLQIQSSVTVLLVTLVTFVAAVLFYNYGKVYRTRQEKEAEPLEKELAMLEEALKRMRGEYEAYSNLLITRSKELTLKVGTRKERDD